MTNQIFKKAIFFVLISTLILPTFFSFSQENTESPNSTTETIDPAVLAATEERRLLEEELRLLEEQLSKIDADISKTEKEKKTLQDQIYVLKKKIEKLDIQIKQGNIMIQDLSLQVKDTENSISQTSLKIESSREKLSINLRTIYENDQKSLVEILLLEKELSDFFDDLVALQTLSFKSQKFLKDIKDLKFYLENQKQNLDEEKADLESVVKIQMLQKKEGEETKQETDYFLKLTEAQYQKYVKEKETTAKRAAEIRARIFELIGVPKAPTFGEAYEIAKFVSQITGLRPAFLLAVLTQESNIGKNVGQCYLKNSQTGDGIYIKSGKLAPRTMSPNEIPYFLEIIKSINEAKNLVRDPFETPVSCCMYYNGQPYGWGGAMGPSQFMPSTWLKRGYSQKVQEITGKVADPWEITDAFLATGLFLRDLGGNKDEFTAAMRYFSGSSWQKWEEFYGRSVLQLASQYEADIKELEQGS